MGERAFPFEKLTESGKALSAMRIECADCESKGYFVQHGNKRLPPLAAEQYFRNHGWKVGNGPRADICPECQKRKKPELKVVPMEPAPKAEQPREMSRDDRRIITAKLDDVYLDGRYQTPWTDAAVSRDLGVPRAWVADVREQFFGPEGSNPEFDEFVAEAAPIIAEMKNMVRSAAAQLEQVRLIEGRIAELERVARKIDREIGK